MRKDFTLEGLAALALIICLVVCLARCSYEIGVMLRTAVPDKRPRMSDLRESGRLEEDADVIVLMYREEYYSKENTPEEERGVAEVVWSRRGAMADGGG